MSRYLPGFPKNSVKKQSAAIYRDADNWSFKKTSSAQSIIDRFISCQNPNLDINKLCFIAVGSIGRNEALNASDLDIIPIAKDTQTLNEYKKMDHDLREFLQKKLDIHVSKGLDLTKPDALSSLTDSESIGGKKDTSQHLTKRILILTEGRGITGGFPLKDIRQAILGAYGNEERSRGRHSLSLCNDIARYYRTLCIEYKTKADHEEDWCTRNLKLRYSRKFWYFANIISIVALAEKHPTGGANYQNRFLEIFEKYPVERLFLVLRETQPIEIGRLLESYSFFLQFMSIKSNREALSKVQHGTRYNVSPDNPFPAMKFNSDLLHGHMLRIIDGLPQSMRRRVLDWFLF